MSMCYRPAVNWSIIKKNTGQLPRATPPKVNAPKQDGLGYMHAGVRIRRCCYSNTHAGVRITKGVTVTGRSGPQNEGLFDWSFKGRTIQEILRLKEIMVLRSKDPYSIGI